MYPLIKFVHVTAVIVWVGGVIVMAVLNARLARAQAGVAIQALGREQGFIGLAVMMPSALTTLLTGFALLGMMGSGLSLWTAWGLAGVFGSIAIGATVLRRTAQQLAQVAGTSENGPAVDRLKRRMSIWGTTNILLLLSTVAAMVMKPTF